MSFSSLENYNSLDNHLNSLKNYSMRDNDLRVSVVAWPSPLTVWSQMPCVKNFTVDYFKSLFKTMEFMIP